MQLPGQLKHTTLGDLLGSLCREGAHGTLELIEPSGVRHSIELKAGKVSSVESGRGGPLLGDLLNLEELPELGEGERLGDVLLRHGQVERHALSEALHRQALARLESLFQLREAAIRFRTPRPEPGDPTCPPPLEQNEFLPGRVRTQKREGERKFPVSRRSGGALEVLGLSPGATAADIRKAFRELAQAHHPDKHPSATSAERHQLFRKFAEISHAYHTLTG